MESCDCHYFILTGISTPNFPTQPALLLLGNSLVLLWVRCPCVATGVWEGLVSIPQRLKYETVDCDYKVTGKGKIYLAIWLFGFLIGEVFLLPANYSNDSRNCLTTQELYISSELQLTQLSTHWSVLQIQSPPRDLSCRYQMAQDHTRYSGVTETAKKRVPELWGQHLILKKSRSTFDGSRCIFPLPAA